MIHSNIIRSNNLVLKNLEANDATSLYLNWLSDSEINAYLEVRFSPPSSELELMKYINDCNNSTNTILFGIFIDNIGHIGNIKLGSIDWNHKIGEIGFLIGNKEHWGKGIAARSIKLICEYAFKNLSLFKITAGYYEENIASKISLINSGFFFEGKRISHCFSKEGRSDLILMGLINNNFKFTNV